MKFLSKNTTSGKEIELFAKTKKSAEEMTFKMYGLGFVTKRVEGRLK